MPGLVLERRDGEAFVIGENIEVTVLGRKGSKIRLLVDAPRDIRVFRKELRKRQEDEK